MSRMTPDQLRNHPNAKKLLGEEPWTKTGSTVSIPVGPVSFPGPAAPPVLALGKTISMVTPATPATPSAPSAPSAPPATKGHKYKVSPKADRTCDGIVFDSKNEMRCFQVLRDSGLKFTLQPEYELQPAFEFEGKKYRPILYIADFLVTRNGQDYVVDVKGMLTPEFKMKLKMLLYVKKLKIVQIKSPKAMLAWIKGL